MSNTAQYTQDFSLTAELSDWHDALSPFYTSRSYTNLVGFLAAQRDAGKIIFPPQDKIFTAFKRTRPQDVRVVILGQDPYHGAGQAHGLSFSVPDGIKPPPSLRNIFKELERDFGYPIPASGNLSKWADQGVLLLNATLTVEEGQAGSHQKQGWEELTDAVIAYLAQTQTHIVFMLWGAYAQKKAAMIDPSRHLILQSVHPSPLSAHRGFIGCGHFSKANSYLADHKRAPVDWTLAK